MEQEPKKPTSQSQPKIQNSTEDEPEDVEKPFCDRPFEEVEDGYIDDRGF